MASQDTTPLKEKILSTLRYKGPSLPVHIAKETGTSILFAGAFLSELATEKKIKISHMKVGSSPVYFIPEQFSRLEKYAEYLKSKEKDAYLLLKEKKFLIDKNLEPAIRVALRQIKDFAVPFEKNGELIWRYFIIPQEEYKETPKEKKDSIGVPQATKLAIEKQEKEKTPKKEIEKKVEIFDEENKKDPKDIPKPKEKKKTKTKKKSSSQNKNDKFFNTVKEFLNKKEIEITDIIGFSKNDLILKIKKDPKEFLLYAFNKKTLTESDIMKAYKKAQSENLNYQIFFLGAPSKKIQTTIDAIKALEGIEKIE